MAHKQVLDHSAPQEDQGGALAKAGHSARLVLNVGSAYVGTLAALSGEGVPLVDFPDNPFGHAVPAKSCVDLSPLDTGREVVLMFEEGDFSRPLLVGCLRNPFAAARHSPPEPAAEAAAPVTCVDGDMVRVSATESLTLRCGQASVTLMRDGRVLINGSYVETRASGTNRIQGGSVRIN